MVKQSRKNSEEQESKAYRVLVGKAEGKRLLRSLRIVSKFILNILNDKRGLD